MKKSKEKISRRDFIVKSSIATLGGGLLLNQSSPLAAEKSNQKSSKVILIRNKDVLNDDGQPRIEVVKEMLDTSIIHLTERKNALDGWKELFVPEDIVGIKTNVWTPIGTTKQVEKVLKDRVMDTGVVEENISVNDRGVLRDPVFQKATALINARPMRTHHWAGVGSLIKNYVMFVPDPYNYHEDACADLGKIWQLPSVMGKTRLNVLVMLTPQFHNVGPHGFSPRHTWKYNGLIVGFDPVAVDTIGVNIIQDKRKEYFGEDRPLNPQPKHIKVADTKYHLGNSDLKNIELIKLGDG